MVNFHPLFSSPVYKLHPMIYLQSLTFIEKIAVSKIQLIKILTEL